MEEIAAAIAKATGKPVVYKQVGLEEWWSGILGFPDELKEILREFQVCIEEFGYYGAEAESLVTWSVENARGKPTNLADYLEAHPLALE